MKKIGSLLPLLPLLLALGCGGGDPAELDEPGDEPGIEEPDAGPGPDEPKPVSVQLISNGTPIVGAPVFAHAQDGSVIATTETDAEGMAVFEALDEDIAVTFPNSVVKTTKKGFATVYGVAPGSELTFGSDAPSTIAVEYSLPDAAPELGAKSYELRMGCFMVNKYAGGEYGEAHIDSACVDGDTLDAAVYAKDASGAHVGYALVQDVPIVDNGDGPEADVEMSNLEWSTDFTEIEVIASNGQKEGVAYIEAYTPGSRSTLSKQTHFAPIEEGGNAVLVAPVIPNLGSEMESVYNIGSVGENSEQLNLRVARSQPFANNVSVSTDFSNEVPSYMAGLTTTSSLRSIAVAQPGTFRCGGDETTPDATLYTVRANLPGGASFEWQVLSPGDSSSLFQMPELPVEYADAWPVAEFESVSIEVGSGAHSGLAYPELSAKLNPFTSLRFPKVEMGDIACLNTVSKVLDSE